MQHTIPSNQLGAWAQPMKKAVNACVHCGFCLPACPTYQELGEEMDSPRGRIFLMKETLEGAVSFDSALTYVDRCLGCLGCETACPSGVKYGELLTPFRAIAERKRKRSFADRALRQLILNTLPFPNRFRWAIRSGQLGKAVSRLLPGRMRTMLDLLPSSLPAAQKLPTVYAHEGERRGTVALLAGCAQQVLAPEINWATLRVLARNGIEVHIPKSQSCCGALAAHTGAMGNAKQAAMNNLRAFSLDVDAIITNAAGCGSGLHEYPLWLRDSEHEESAKRFAEKTCDVSVYLTRIGLVPPAPLSRPVRVAYHDACHLAHAQKVKREPRQLLRAIANLELVEIPDGEMCCGSAGTYNLEQPETANELGIAKAANIASTAPDYVASGNIGCMTQIQSHLERRGSGLARGRKVLHTMEVLDLAYRGQLAGRDTAND
ncbi:MAG: 4Fe-4S dicluster domain-containing protein [Planctomycetales bacterium]|nr:4Fe-4S dicluster domain-containing protein [Planctomycetales bacterium]